ncbi:hypothetical protein TNCV_3863801 [Trichonephila clavipes]|nr:hypothetical protein TNCV_3863801 [Trichonephila clavipes]
MHKYVQMLDKNYCALGQTARVCIGVLRTNRTREAERDFCGLPIRRDEGRVVDPPLVFKRVFSGDEEEEPCPGSRELERRALFGNVPRKNLGWRQLEESAKEIGVERKERR